MTPQHPYRCKSTVTQAFNNKSDRYKNGVHLGIDYVPLDEKGRAWPAPVHPILPGQIRETATYETLNGKNSKCLAIDTELDPPFIAYLKAKGQLEPAYRGRVILFHTYLHGLQLLKKSGVVNPTDEIMLTGNTGMTYTKVGTEFVPVPEDKKGVPPYPGLHLHLQCEAITDRGIHLAYIDPQIILNYKPVNEFVKILNYKGEVGLFIAADDIPTLVKLGKIFGKPVEVDENNNVTNTDIVIN